MKKRTFDIVLAVTSAFFLAPIFLFVSITILLKDGRPIFYLSERMQTPCKSFQLIKFRTMKCTDNDRGVSGGDKSSRITGVGKFLRKSRLDEIPQIWNILLGHMSFVGPRPPLREYVEILPDLYADVLTSRPGVTGLATLVYHKTEERLLGNCSTPEETQEVYVRCCIPRKATLDLIYQRNATVRFDFCLTVATFLRAFFHIPFRSFRKLHPSYIIETR